ncbi:MAG: hypothetical protein R2880_08785 [Deinococcales bacterium]
MPHGITTASQIAGLLEVRLEQTPQGYAYYPSETLSADELDRFFRGLSYAQPLKLSDESWLKASSWDPTTWPTIFIEFKQEPDSNTLKLVEKIYQTQLRTVYRPLSQGPWYMLIPPKKVNVEAYVASLKVLPNIQTIEAPPPPSRLPKE